MDNVHSGVERRKHKRVAVNFIIRYRIRKPLEVVMLIGNMEINAVMIDLSEGGMAVITDYEIPLGAELSLKFTLINTFTRDYNERNRVVDTLGQVMNIIPMGKANRLGISFIDIPNQDKIVIADFVKLAFKSSL